MSLGAAILRGLVAGSLALSPPPAPPPRASPPDDSPPRAGEPAPAPMTTSASEDATSSRANVVESTRISTLRLRVPEGMYEPLRAALTLRMPDVEIVQHGETPATAPDAVAGFAFVGVGARHGDMVTLVVITSEGAAWTREVAADEDVATALARELSVLLASIEAGEVTPERTNVDIPDEDVTDEALSELVEGDASADATPPREPPSAAGNEAPPLPPPEPPRDERCPQVPRLRIGGTLAPAILLALPPQLYADAFAGVGGGLGLDLRTRRGLAATVDVRTVADTANPIALVRTRVALGLGGTVVRGRFHGDVMAFASVEPFVVQADREPLTVLAPGNSPPAPLLGGFARVDLLGAVLDRPRVTLLLGPRIELGGSLAPGGRVPALADPRGPAFRPGGLELGVGVVLRVLVGIAMDRDDDDDREPPRRRRRSPRG